MFYFQPHIRTAAITALNAWYDQIGLAPFIEGEIIFGALSTENPFLRTEVKFMMIIMLNCHDYIDNG